MQHTILVVEDDEGIREALRGLFEDEGYRVVTAENGRRALDFLIVSEPPSIVFLDMMMPVMDGAQFLAAVTDYAHLKPVPIVLVTAGDIRLEDPHVRHIIRKPMASETLMKLVNRYCPQ